jgi:hypothetical protein
VGIPTPRSTTSTFVASSLAFGPHRAIVVAHGGQNPTLGEIRAPLCPKSPRSPFSTAGRRPREQAKTVHNIGGKDFANYTYTDALEASRLQTTKLLLAGGVEQVGSWVNKGKKRGRAGAWGRSWPLRRAYWFIYGDRRTGCSDEGGSVRRGGCRTSWAGY